MYQKIIQLRILELFLENPAEKYYLREAARLLKISPMTLKRSLDFLLKENMIIRQEEKNNIFYKGNTGNILFKYQKICHNLFSFEKNKLVESIIEALPATAIILYGSCAKGENTSESDIDILVISPKKENPSLEISKKLKKEVNIKIFSESEWAKQAHSNRAYYMDIITEGIVLHGTRPIAD